ncbi:piwi-like protein 1 isoform X3 [Felis catus]|uniref:piwi-like protein 1 isoform X3 n=1 Tax=Felis catus TaxID=9685 RepID=UPI001D19A815|nr:piwi-like protein 1 isoform X3 [Felis catus]
MTGRARARARGRACGQETVQHVGAAASQPPGFIQPRPQQPAAEGELVGRGRQRGAGGAPAKSQDLQISAGFQELSLAERGGRRRDFHDLGVNTRQNLDHVRESKTGSSGIIVRLSTNHFRLTSRPQWALYQYHIDYNPLMEARRLRSALLFQHEDLIGRCHAFDGTILFLPKRLQHKVTEVFSQTRNGEHVRITITLTNELPPTSPTCLQFYNIIFRRLLKIMNLQQIGRNYYNPSDPIDIPNHRLVIWPGFTTSILQYENNIMLCTDVSHKVLRSETVLDFMFNLYHQIEEHKFQEQVSKELIGLIVLTKYNNKTYRVDDIDWDQNPKSTFKKADGSEISFLEYYRKFDYNPQFADWSKETRGAPLISVKPLDNWLLIYTRRNYEAANSLIQNLFKVTPAMGIQMKKAIMIEVDDRTEAYLRVLQQKVTSDTQIVVCLLSSNRKDKYDAIKKYLCTDCPTPSQCVVARTLGKQQTVMAIATKIALQMNCKMGGELWRVDMPLKLAMIVGIDCYHDTTAGRRSIAGFVASINEGMTRWFSRCVFQDRGQELVDGLKVCLQAALRAWNSCNEYMPSRIVVYRDGVGDGQLKTLVNYEVPQFLDCLKSVGRGYNEYFFVNSTGTDVLLRPWGWRARARDTLVLPEHPACALADRAALCLPPLPRGSETVPSPHGPLEELRFASLSGGEQADVRPDRCVRGSLVQNDGRRSQCRRSPRSSERPVCAFSQQLVSLQKGGRRRALEGTCGLGARSRLLRWSGGYFRVGLGQLLGVDGTRFLDPRLTVIVVKKRVNARFFAQSGGRLQNPLPGTVIDVEVTRPEWYDFFIVSQAVRSGSVSPTHYNVIYDNSGLKPDHIQRLTYKLCHVYYNWPVLHDCPTGFFLLVILVWSHSLSHRGRKAGGRRAPVSTAQREAPRNEKRPGAGSEATIKTAAGLPRSPFFESSQIVNWKNPDLQGDVLCRLGTVT